MSRRLFPSTLWTAWAQDPQRAREEIFLRYWPAVFSLLRGRGFQESDAQDMAQEVFVRVCRAEFLDRLDRSRCRFRHMLLSVTRNVVRERRREARRRRETPIDELAENFPTRKPGEEERDFDRLWIRTLLNQAFERLQREPRGGPPYYEALVLFQYERLSYKHISERLGATVDQVTNWIHHARKRLRNYLAEAVREYSSSEEERKEELRFLAEPIRDSSFLLR